VDIFCNLGVYHPFPLQPTTQAKLKQSLSFTNFYKLLLVAQLERNMFNLALDIASHDQRMAK
jgi:hypothetical protein